MYSSRNSAMVVSQLAIFVSPELQNTAAMATRLPTLPLLGMTFVIEVFVSPEYWTMHLMWASIPPFLLTRGPGVFSFDHYVKRDVRRKGFVA